MRHLDRYLRISGITLSLVLFSFSLIFAQDNPPPPQAGFTYQAVARDVNGYPLIDQDLTVRIAIRAGSEAGETVWQEDHNVTTNQFGLFTLMVGGPEGFGHTGTAEMFSAIDWSAAQYFLGVQVNDGSGYQTMGASPIQTVPVAQYAQSAKNSSGNFSVQADKVNQEGEALFEVKRSDGSVAFAVYEDMVWVYVDTSASKGLKGGFAVGGYSSSKAPADEFLRVTPDSVRVYIKDDGNKGVKGGFAVGGYSSSNKSPGDQYLYVKGNDPVNDDFSIALGVGADASGPYSTAIGYKAVASDNNAIALGNSAISAGLNASSMGFGSKALGDKSIAIGSHYSYSFSIPYFNILGKGDSKDFIIRDPIITPTLKPLVFNRANIAEGDYSISFGNGNLSQEGGMALGSNNDAIGFGSVAIGVSNKALNTNAFAAGYASKAIGYYATAFGNNSYAKSYGSFVIGQYNTISDYYDSTKWVNNDPLFVVGNGLNEDNRSNALTIFKDGRTILNGADASLTLNERINFRRFTFNPPSIYYELSVFGVRSYINCSDRDVDKYYSAYFYHTGDVDDNYQGFYADMRAGNSADVAEYIHDTSGDTEPGDVLVADPDNQVSTIVSSHPYDPSVIGVVSTKPHLTMGMELVIDEETGASLPNAQATRLALTGRVPCKVTDENGPIKPGDLLTTSSTPGHAMKWTPLDFSEAKDFDELKAMMTENEMRRHAVIGKALETHSGGTGKIMVLISLQ
jgi:hypothetical protein